MKMQSVLKRTSVSPRVAHILCAMALFLFLIPGKAHADSVVMYDFSGTLATPIGGSTSVTGTFSLDTTTSTITTFNFTSPIGSFTTGNSTSNFFAYTPANSPKQDFLQFAFDNPTNDGVLLLLFQSSVASFNASTPLYTSALEPGMFSPAEYSLIFCDVNCTGQSFFTSGSASPAPVTPPTSAPEPSSLLMLSGGLLGLAPFLRRRLSIQ